MKRLMAIAFAAFALLGADGRDTAIYNGKLTSAMNANGMAITNAPTPVRDGDLVNKAYVDGISGVTPGTVTNIANARIDAKVAPWAMSGQPRPEGMTTNEVRDIASSAAVTNAGAVASAKAYADGTFLGKTATASNADKLDGKHANEFVWNSGGDMYGSYNYVSTSYPDNRTTVSCFGIDFDDEDGGIKYDIGNHAIKFYTTIFPSVKTSKLVPDNSPVVTSNMLNGVLTPALAQKVNRQVPSAVGNFAALDAQGNLADSGCSTNSFAPAVQGGYLPLSGGVMNGNVAITNNNSYNGVMIGVDDEDEYTFIAFIDRESLGREYEIYSGAGAFFFNCSGHESYLAPDDTPVMTVGQADFHIVSNATSVTSGQIADYDLTGLTAKTITVLFDAGMKSGDTLIWTAGNTANCEITFSITGYTQIGDTGYATATANKKCLFSIVKISANEVIISKKEY